MNIEQPAGFVGWWEAVFYIKDGETHNVEGILEHIRPDGRFELYRNGELVGGGQHEEFRVDPQGFTNVHETVNPIGVGGRELAIYRFEGDRLEVCKAPEELGRPTEFESIPGSSIVHAAIRRIPDDDPRVPI